MGRPCGYTPRMGAKICDQLAQGKSLTEICDQPGYPDRGTVRRWVSAQPAFRASYESSRLAWADELFEEIVVIADKARQIAEDADAREGNANAAVAALREEIRAKMWVCARLRPDRYGDRSAIEMTGAGGGPLVEPPDPARIATALAAVLAANRSRAPVFDHEHVEARQGGETPAAIGVAADPVPALQASSAPSLATPERREFNPANGQVIRRSLLTGESPGDGISAHATRYCDFLESKVARLPVRYSRRRD